MKCSRCGTEFSGNFCPECGTPAVSAQFNGGVQESQAQQQIAMQEEQLRIQREQLAMQRNAEQEKMVCPRCHSNSVVVQAVAEQKKRGCFMSALWVLLAIFTVGLILWVPLLTRKGSKTRTYAICQTCGFRWRV